MRFWKNRKVRYTIYIVGFIVAIILGALDQFKEKLPYPWLREAAPFLLVLEVAVVATIELREKLRETAKPQRARREVEGAADPHELSSIQRTLLHVVETTCNDIVNNEMIHQIKGRTLKHEYSVKPNHNFYQTPQHFLKKRKDHFVPMDWDIQQHNFGLAFTGEPGNGKTYGMCSWILDRIDPIKQEAGNGKIHSKIPVFLSLTEWADGDLEEWIVEGIAKRYQLVNHQDSIRELLLNKQLIPCLDGLDEINAGSTSHCLQKIYDLVPVCGIVFSCRREEFTALLENEENFRSANYIRIVSLEKLTKPVIGRVLRETVQGSEGMLQFLDGHPDLYGYINTPLFLNLFIITVHSFSEEEKKGLTAMAQDKFEDKLWEGYDSIMIARIKGSEKKRKTIRTYLTVLAQKMTGTSFLLDQIQPPWLPRFGQVLYYFLSRSISGLLAAIATGFFIATPLTFLSNGLLASVTVTMLTLLLNSKYPWVEQLRKIRSVMLFTVVLVIATAIYQGFSVPRSSKDMLLGHRFSLTESFSGILLGLFFGCLFGYRKRWQTGDKDIHPLEDFYFQWREAAKIGIRSGLAIGALMGVSGIVIELLAPDTSFGVWLHQSSTRTNNMVQRALRFLPPKAYEIISVLLLGFSVGFLVGGLIFVLMGGRRKEQLEMTAEERRDAKKYYLNFGIRKSLLISSRLAFISCGGLFIFYSCFIFFFNPRPEGFIRAAMIGMGTGIVAFLWFGGIEVIQHWTLRLCLYLFGIMPIRYGDWIDQVCQHAIIRKVGASLEFYHPTTLRRYYQNIAADKSKTVNTKKIFYLVLGLIVVAGVSLYLAILPFYLRSNGGYWQHGSEILADTSSWPEQIARTPSDTAFVVSDSGVVQVEISGMVHLGTFTGWVGPEGTETGIFGFPMKDVYDRDSSTFKFRHGALLYRIRHDHDWPWKAVIHYKHYIIPWSTRKGNIRVHKGDTLIFSVNDREWENNSGHLELSLSFSRDSGETTKPDLHGKPGTP